jgi:hypothetical protein
MPCISLHQLVGIGTTFYFYIRLSRPVFFTFFSHFIIAEKVSFFNFHSLYLINFVMNIKFFNYWYFLDLSHFFNITSMLLSFMKIR